MELNTTILILLLYLITVVGVIIVMCLLFILYDIVQLLIHVYTNIGEKKRQEQRQIMRILKNGH